VVALILLGALLAWHFWPRPAPVDAPTAPGWPSPLDVLDTAQITDADWPLKGRPAEAVGVLDLSHDANRGLKVDIVDGVVLIKDALEKEVVRIDSYAPPPPQGGGGGGFFDPRTGRFIPDVRLIMGEFGPRDEHKLIKAALSPKADRLVLLGWTNHIEGRNFVGLSGKDPNWSARWVLVWRWEGDTLTPLEPQPLEGKDARAAAFSADGKLLATSGKQGTDIWELGNKKLRHLGQIRGEKELLLFAPDGRSLAVTNSRSFALYDLGPILPGGWERWRLFSIALGLAVAAVVALLAVLPSEDAREGWSRVGTTVAFLGVGACLAWSAWRPVPAGAPLNFGLGFGAVLAVFLLLSAARRLWPIISARRRAGEYCLFLVTSLGALVCLGWWGWQFWWPSPAHLTPSHCDLASADIKAACFSANGRELAAVRADGRLSLFDVTTGKENRGWNMPAGVKEPEFAPDGRHLLAVADNKAYVLRLKPIDEEAFVLNCCETVLRHDPQAVDALLARGHVRLHRGKLDEAIKDFTEVIALDGKNAAAYHGRGLARTDRGDYAAARADFAEALRLDPELADSSSRRPKQ
jgi:hypothetical protein